MPFCRFCHAHFVGFVIRWYRICQVEAVGGSFGIIFSLNCGYSLEAITEVILMRTRNIYFYGQIKKNTHRYPQILLNIIPTLFLKKQWGYCGRLHSSIYPSVHPTHILLHVFSYGYTCKVIYQWLVLFCFCLQQVKG